MEHPRDDSSTRESDRCLFCGYILVKPVSLKCPECGEATDDEWVRTLPADAIRVTSTSELVFRLIWPIALVALIVLVFKLRKLAAELIVYVVVIPGVILYFENLRTLIRRFAFRAGLRKPPNRRRAIYRRTAIVAAILIVFFHYQGCGYMLSKIIENPGL